LLPKQPYSVYYVKMVMVQGQGTCWLVYGQGASIKDVRTKSRRIDPLPLCSQNLCTGSTPLPLVRADAA